ncbi:MAG: MopE-related protein, partial [Nanobdellota archaeon]
MNKTALPPLIIFLLVVLAMNGMAEPTHSQVEVGKPVQWEKTINKENIQTPEVAVKVANVAENIKVVQANDRRPIKASVKEGSKFKNLITGFATITGFAVNDGTDFETKEVKFNQNDETDYKVIYETPAPKIEVQTTKERAQLNKKIRISSHIHYTDILSYVDVPDIKKETIHLYHKQGGLLFNERVEITNNPDYKVEFLDLNNNGLIDRVKWITPHLSTQDFELEGNLTVLDVQSYPLVGGNWTVRFVANGTDDLTIQAVNGTGYGTDLHPKEIKCNNQSIPFQLQDNTITIEDFYCNETAYHTVEVNTSGKHYQRFTFKGESELAQNNAQDPSLSFYRTSDDCLNQNNVISESNPAAMGEIIYVRFGWLGGESQQLLAVKQNSGTCTFADQSGCLAHEVLNPTTSPYCQEANHALDPSIYDGSTNTIEATFRNGSDSDVTTTATLYVSHNPTITATLNPSGQVPTSESLDCEISISDEDSGDSHDLDIQWFVNGSQHGSTISITGLTTTTHTESLPNSQTSPGDTWHCDATVTDSTGLTDSDTSDSATITDSQLSISPDTGSTETVGSNLQISASGGTTPYTYTSSDGSICSFDSGSSRTSIDSDSGVDLYFRNPGNCSVQATDSAGAASTSLDFEVVHEEISIDPQPEELERFTETDFSVSGSSATTFTWSVTNLTGPQDGLEITSDADQGHVTVAANEVGEYILEVVDGNNAHYSLNLTISDTVPPEAVVNVTARDVLRDQGNHIEISWDASTSSDIYGYYLMRSETQSGGTNITPRNLSAPDFILDSDATYTYIDNSTQDGQTYYYWVYACDDMDNCVASTVNAHAQSNAQPILLQDETVIEPKNPTGKDNVSFIVFASDINNETLSMRYNCTVAQFDPGGSNYHEHGNAWCFYLGPNVTSQYGVTFGNATTECLFTIDSQRITKADKLSCTFIFNDGKENSTIGGTDGFIPIHNTPPEAHNITINPSGPNQSSELTCNYTYHDFDTDPEDPTQATFKWYINNEGLNEFVEVKGYTQKTLSGIFDKDDVVKCAVKVHDDDQSWMDEDNFSTTFYESKPVTIIDNAVPQIIQYSNTHDSPDNPALIGGMIDFTAVWKDYEDPDDTARMYVCDDYFDEQDLYDQGKTLVSFGDTPANKANEVILYSNKTGDYVHKIGLYPDRYIRNSKTTYSAGSRVNATDVDSGSVLYNFSEVYFDSDLSDTYTRGEAIIIENTSSAALDAGAQKLVYDKEFDTIVVGDPIPDQSPLRSFTSQNIFRHTGINFTEESDIYWDKDNDSTVSEGDMRITIVTQSEQDSASTEFIFDIIVMEVDNIGDTQGTIIARDNDNAFELGRYNYFTPQYNAQPLPDKYLAFKLCIDNNNDDTCDSNNDNLEDKVFLRTNSSYAPGQPLILNASYNYSHPHARLFYGGDIHTGCEGDTYCSTNNSAAEEQSCQYAPNATDPWSNTYRVKVCDEHDACSIYREGNFFVNHLPNITAQIRTTEGDTNFTNDANLNCTYTADDPDPHNVSSVTFSWYLKRGNSTFKKVNLPDSPIVTNGNTMPGDQWRCNVTPYDPFQKGISTLTDGVTISGLPPPFHIEEVQDTSQSGPIAEGENVTFTLDWYADYSTTVKAYVCDSPQIVGSGCMGRTIAQSEFTVHDPIMLNHTVGSEDNTSQEYWVMICDGQWNCSNIYPSVTNASLSFLTNHRPTASDTQVRQISFSAEGTARCLYNYSDPDNDLEAQENTSFRWYTVNQDNYTLIPGQDGEDLSDPFSYGDEITCAVKVIDSRGLADETFRNASNVLKKDGIPPPPRIWTPPVSVKNNTGIYIAGYFGIPDINYSVHARQDYEISPASGDITGFTSINSTYYGSINPVDASEEGLDYIIVPATSIEPDNIIQVGRYIQFTNHYLTNFSRYRVESYRNLFDDTYKVVLDPALRLPVNESTEFHVYDTKYPSGFFIIELPELFNGTNLIRIRGKNDNGNGPFSEFETHVDKGSPIINTSSIPEYAMSTEPVIYFTVHDDFHINTLSIKINATNQSGSTIYTLANHTEGNDTIVCTGNRTLQYCQSRLYLAMNSTYNLTFTVNDTAGWFDTSTVTNFSITQDKVPVEGIENGFYDENMVLHLPATIATDPLLVANWSQQSGIISHYEYKLEEYDGNTLRRSVTEWLNTSNSTHTFITISANLTNDMIYKFRVRPRYIDESTGPESLSSGIVYFVNDAPQKEYIRFRGEWNGTGNASALFTSSPSRLALEWNFSNEAQITQYRYAVGPAKYPEEGYNALASNNDYSQTELILTDLPLQDGVDYYASVRAKNENNIWSNWYSSEYPITVDLTPPHGGDLQYPTGLRATNFTVTIIKGRDNISGIKTRNLMRATGILQEGECSDLNIFYPVDTNLGSGTYTQSVQNGKCYAFRYIEKDYVNNTRVYMHGGSAAFTYVDQTAPEGFTVTLNNGEFITTTNQFYVDWTPSNDPEMGISHYSYALFKDENQLGTWTKVDENFNSTKTHAVIEIDDPSHQSAYKVKVSAYSNGNLTNPTTEQSNSVVYLDTTEPEKVSILKVENDTDAPFSDRIDNNQTDILVEGEEGMRCVASKYLIDYEDYNPSKTYLENCSKTGTSTNLTCFIDSSDDGLYTRYIVCRDEAGNKQFADKARQVSWYVDFMAPQINITYDDPVIGGLVQFPVQLRDTSQIDTMTYTIRNSTDILKRETERIYESSANISIEWDTAFLHKENITLQVNATDMFNQTASVEKNYTLDNSLPAIRINVPNSNDRFFKEGFRINASITNIFYNTSWQIYGEQGLMTNNSITNDTLQNHHSWSDYVNTSDWNDGQYTLSVYAVGPYKSNKKQAEFYIDNVAPRYSADSLINPPSPVYNNQSVAVTAVWNSTYNFFANTCDLDQVFISHNASGNWTNVTPTIDGDLFSYEIPQSLLDNGEKIGWRSYAKDFSGNQNQTPIMTFIVSNREMTFYQDIPDLIWPANINVTIDMNNHIDDPDDDRLQYNITYIPTETLIYDRFEYEKTTKGTLHDPQYSTGHTGKGLLIESASRNLVQNPGFEDMADGLVQWHAHNQPSINDTSFAGNNSVMVNRNNYFTQVIEVLPGRNYSISAYIRSLEDQTYGRLHLDWLDSSMRFIETGLICGAGTNCTVTPLVNQTFTRKSATVKSPQSAEYARLYLDSHNASYVLVDNIQVEEKDYATTYTEGFRYASYVEYDTDLSGNYTINLWFKGIREGHPLITLANATSQYTVRPGPLTGWNMLTLRHTNETDIFLNGIYNHTVPGLVPSSIQLGRDIRFAETTVDDFTVIKRAVDNTTITNWMTSFAPSTEMNHSIASDNITFFTLKNRTTSTGAIIEASDGFEKTTTNPFTLTTVEANLPPILEAIPDFVLPDTENLSYQLNVTEPDNETLNYTITNPKITINSTGFMFWNITGWDAGFYEEELTVCDNRSVINSCTSQTFTINITMIDVDNDGISDTVDTLLANYSSITTNYANFTIAIDGETNLSKPFTGVKTIEFIGDGEPIASLTWNFSNQLDLMDTTINGSLWYSKITGLDLQNDTKEVYLHEDSAIKTVCVKDNENMTMTPDCNGPDEYLLYCNQSNDPLYTNGYDCRNESGKYIISGLHHSYVATTQGCKDLDGDGYGYGELCPADCNENDSLRYQMYPYYRDLDLDNFTVSHSQMVCGNGTDIDNGTWKINRTNQTDCNDTDPDRYHMLPYYRDLDLDNFTVSYSQMVCGNGTDIDNGLWKINRTPRTDCADNDASINPDAEEICGNGIDEDCDGTDKRCTVDNSGSSSDNDGDSPSGGAPPPCSEDWVCSEWSQCSDGQQTRTCSDQNECGTEQNKPITTQACQSCDDGVQNQGEEGIDCGGPCEPCTQPTCSDDIQNQGEEGIDCGGPCEPC